MSYKNWVTTSGDNGNYATNSLAFKTKEEADDYGNELASRWFAVVSYETRESDDPVNYEFVNGQAKRIE